MKAGRPQTPVWLTRHFSLCLKIPDEVAEKLLKFGMEDKEDEEQRLIEERRKRLQEIKAKHQQQMVAAGGGPSDSDHGV